MNHFLYYHRVPPSIESGLIQFFMGLLGLKRAMEKKIIRNTFSKKPASIPSSILKKFHVEAKQLKGRNVWTISPENGGYNTVILFLHGGAYFANITYMHWQFIEQVLNGTNTALIVPDYPLAPDSNCKNTYQFLDHVYRFLTSNYQSKQIVFMGDSAGGGLALGFAQKIRDEGLKQPEQIFLFSPWLDVSMNNPDLAKFDQVDKILSVTGLKRAGEIYAGEFGVKDFRVSPIYGDCSRLGKISIFIGTNEIFIADARKFKHLLEKQHLNFNYFEYPKMFHDWILVKNLKETKDVIQRISALLN